MKLLYLSHHWTNNSHHSRHSGFQRLVQFAAENNDTTLVTWGVEDGEYTEGRIHVITVKGNRRDYLFQKRIAISRKGAELAPQFDTVHALYDDCSFALPPDGYTVTFHVLPGVVRYRQIKQRIFIFLKYRILQRRALRNSASIACVSKNLLAAIPAPYQGKAHFIPHGVDTNFWDPALAAPPASLPAGLFSPPATSPELPDSPGLPDGGYILCVGSHGIDRNTLTGFIRANPRRSFVMVGMKPRLTPLPNARYLYNVSDEELRNLYGGASMMIRPLEFATANNSVLEALAMGKTILVSRVPGVTDYVDDQTAVFIDTLPDKSLADIESRLLDPLFIRQTTIGNFSWTRIFSEYTRLYHENLSHGKPARSIQAHA